MKLSSPQRHRLNRDAAVTGKDVETMQNNFEQWANQFADCPLLNGVLVEDVTVTGAVEFKVAHKLGIKPTGYIVVKNSNPWWGVFVSSDENYLTLQTPLSGNQIYSFWVF